MVTLKDRIDYYNHLNGTFMGIYQDKDDNYYLPDRQADLQSELEAIPEQDVQDYLDNLIISAQAILDKQEIADLKHASLDAMELLGKSDQWISDNIESITAGTTKEEITAGIREALKRSDRINRDILNALKAMVKE